MARTRCHCGGPVVTGEGYERCVNCGETRRVGEMADQVDTVDMPRQWWDGLTNLGRGRIWQQNWPASENAALKELIGRADSMLSYIRHRGPQGWEQKGLHDLSAQEVDNLIGELRAVASKPADALGNLGLVGPFAHRLQPAAVTREPFEEAP